MTRHPSDRRKYITDRRKVLDFAIKSMRSYNGSPIHEHAADMIERMLLVPRASYEILSRRGGTIRRAEDRPAPEPEPKKETAPDEVPFVSLTLSDVWGAIKDADLFSIPKEREILNLGALLERVYSDNKPAFEYENFISEFGQLVFNSLSSTKLIYRGTDGIVYLTLNGLGIMRLLKR